MRVAVGDFGPIALIELRVGLAALFLLPAALWRGKLPVIARHWKALLVVGTLNAAVPFLLYAYAAQSLGAGFLSVANAVTPVWGAVVGWLWLKDRLPWMRSLGLMIGFLGIIVLVWGQAELPGGRHRAGGAGRRVGAGFLRHRRELDQALPHRRGRPGQRHRQHDRGLARAAAPGHLRLA